MTDSQSPWSARRDVLGQTRFGCERTLYGKEWFKRHPTRRQMWSARLRRERYNAPDAVARRASRAAKRTAREKWSQFAQQRWGSPALSRVRGRWVHYVTAAVGLAAWVALCWLVAHFWGRVFTH